MTSLMTAKNLGMESSLYDPHRLPTCYWIGWEDEEGAPHLMLQLDNAYQLIQRRNQFRFVDAQSVNGFHTDPVTHLKGRILDLAATLAYFCQSTLFSIVANSEVSCSQVLARSSPTGLGNSSISSDSFIITGRIIIDNAPSTDQREQVRDW
ncbi:hypothetical protein LSTR_LSTR010040 [Laodelphax striatellus]|uniref:Uncharacterized protein n=1 Tax=Laodelphax striatellus TaxID=195883 RepID=A0A482WN93_LAOST|nr:hypothetical protein LSTR_LSTR010040 [Laodelphax striatellus]